MTKSKGNFKKVTIPIPPHLLKYRDGDTETFFKLLSEMVEREYEDRGWRFVGVVEDYLCPECNRYLSRNEKEITIVLRNSGCSRKENNMKEQKGNIGPKEEGEYLILQKTWEGLLITLTPEGKELLKDITEGYDVLFWQPEDELFPILMEDHLCNGWDIINPEDISALTSTTLISDTAEWNDEGELTNIESVYLDPDYQVRATTEELYNKGFIIWKASF